MPYSNPNNKFVFTLHHWTQTDWEHLALFSERNKDVVFLKVCQEKGSGGETPHLQGCVVFGRSFKKQRPSAVSKLLMGPNKDNIFNVLIAVYFHKIRLFVLEQKLANNVKI